MYTISPSFLFFQYQGRLHSSSLVVVTSQLVLHTLWVFYSVKLICQSVKYRNRQKKVQKSTLLLLVVLALDLVNPNFYVCVSTENTQKRLNRLAAVSLDRRHRNKSRHRIYRSFVKSNISRLPIEIPRRNLTKDKSFLFQAIAGEVDEQTHRRFRTFQVI